MTIPKPWLLAALSLVIVGTFFGLREHWAHVLGLAPYLLLLLCPFLHLFHGHGGHEGHGGRAHGPPVHKGDER